MSEKFINNILFLAPVAKFYSYSLQYHITMIILYR